MHFLRFRSFSLESEVHTGEELTRALDLECDAIGVNNRDLRSLEVRLEVSLELAARSQSPTCTPTESRPASAPSTPRRVSVASVDQISAGALVSNSE